MLTEVLIWLGIILTVLGLFGITIFMHELGHFLAARWRGMVVERFSIGFGPRIWGKKINGVDWCVCAIPFGGYVALPQLAPMELLEGKTESVAPLPEAKPFDKIIVALGGPFFSALFGIFLAFVVWIVGRPMDANRLTTVVGYVYPEMPAAKADNPLKAGDRIISVDEKSVTDWSASPNSIVEAVIFSTGDQILINAERPSNGGVDLVTSAIKPIKDEIYQLRRIGVQEADDLIVRKVLSGSPAENAGIQPGDRILTVDGEKIYSFLRFKEIVVNKANQQVAYTYLRNGREALGVFVPQIPKDKTEAFVGIEWKRSQNIVHQNPGKLLSDSLIMMKKTVQAVGNPNSDVGLQHLSGPVGILTTQLILLREDVRLALWFMVVLNVNLALLNLLPFPVLDGGHILLSLIEAIVRRPLPAKVIHGLQSAFSIIIIAFMLYVTFFDGLRIWKASSLQKESSQKSEDEKIEFLPEPKPANHKSP